MATAFHCWHSAATCCSSARVNTLPVGLWGVFTTMARVRGPKAAASVAGSKHHAPPAAAGGEARGKVDPVEGNAESRHPADDRPLELLRLRGDARVHAPSSPHGLAGW